MNEKKKIKIARLLERNILPYNMGDLAILDTIQPKTHRNTCAVPTAMLIFSTLDYLGFHLQIEGNKWKTKFNITIALKSQYYPHTFTDEEIHQITSIYRNGIMHSFFPNQDDPDYIYGIHKSGKSELFEEIMMNEKVITSLNVNVLSDHFKQFINNLYAYVRTSSHDRGSATTTMQTTSPIG